MESLSSRVKRTLFQHEFNQKNDFSKAHIELHFYKYNETSYSYVLFIKLFSKQTAQSKDQL